MNAFWRTYYHLVWATKGRSPLITPDRELLLYPYIQGKVDEMGGMVQAMGGVRDHVHLIVSIPPTIAVTDFVKRIKGSSSHYLNHHPEVQGDWFMWQRGYGVFTLGSQQCDRAIAYVLNQKQHHGKSTTIAMMEYFPEMDEP
jgi:putative transposase